MNSYIKHIVEAFDFNTVTKQKKVINAHDILFNDKLKNIVYKIVNKPTLGTKDREFILSLPDASYTANDEEFPRLIQRCIKYFGKDCNLNWIDTSEITSMNKLFNPKEWDQTYFHGDISKWDVSNVKDMSKLFHRTDFNGDISQWDVSNVKDMNNMFAYSNFNRDISNWDVSNVLDMQSMFSNSSFNGDISKWNVGNVVDMSWMFRHSVFTGDISKWNVSNVVNMQSMFSDSEFNGDINQWNVSNVNEMQWLFNSSKFNKNISNWNVSNVINMKGMFEDSQFNKNISSWHINPNCNITNIFNKCPIKKEYKPIVNNIIKSRLNYNNINKNIADIDDILINIISKIILLEKSKIEEYKILTSFVSIYKVKNSEELVNIRKHFCGLFGNSVNLNWLDVSEITDMCWAFSRADFNGDISKWDVSNVKNMSWMFKESTFNGDISNWDVSNVTNMTEMFYESNFNGDISSWDVSNVTTTYNIFKKCAILDKYKPVFIKK